MDEFAAICGISRPTLSKYFHDPASVRPTTRARIEDALRQHDYRPNIYAMNQNRQRTRNIGVVVPNLSDPFFTEIGRRVELACIAAGYQPILLSSHGNLAQEMENLDSLRALKPAGVLLAPFGRLSDQAAIRAFGADIPLVLFDADIEDAGQGFVGIDHHQSIGLMVEYLCRSGSPPCLFEMETPSNPNANKRHHAYLEAMARLGHRPHILQAAGSGWDFEQIGFDEGTRLLRAGLFARDTILCSNDRLAIGLLSAAYELGLKVGCTNDCDLRIAGHDDHPFARFTCPTLTTISQDYDSIARESVALLVAAIESDPDDPPPRRRVLFDGGLVMRGSS